MEASLGSVALTVVLVSIVAWAWSLLNWVWFRPKKLERYLRQQGLAGNSYRLLFGDLKEISMIHKQVRSKPMNHLSHDIVPHILPFLHQTLIKQKLKFAGKNSFIWMGPTLRVNILNPEDLRDVLHRYDDFRKPLSNPITKVLSQGLVNIDGEKWTKHRKIINPAFHLEKLKFMVPIFYQSCSEMIDTWENLVANEGLFELDVWPWLQSLAGDVISRAAFGSSYEEGKKIFQLLKEQARIGATLLRSATILHLCRFLPSKMNKRMKEINREIRVLIMDIINKRERTIKAGDDINKDDLLRMLLESNSNEIKELGNNKNLGMSIEEVIEECKLFYFVGQETTAALLVWAMVLLSHNQNWQNRAREEVLQVTMILLEVLRLYPPGVEVSRITHNTTQLGKLSLPAGVDVYVPILLVHHDKELWGDDADEFKPERFSGGVSKATNNRFTYFPFGAGPRICIGQNFAMMEAKLALSLILQHFTFELSSSYAHDPLTYTTLQPQSGAHIILRKRRY
ncbi:cytochrome P450 CYP72A219-like [Pyrus ussuriensis x Pyrus communis]|uniref:Cytochrome P450 CYP72A219-like n=1 Tax=Pyrus ussuriensis x Pyrus communis TaxID=2448454 RepID=A0A5N5FW85_9ROSA|nr:cytochrome P450 CYP72A219-like [Pyrus ussuriensis x Pyrus communis]